MAGSGKRWSKEDFDNTFDEFINTPLSSGDDDTERIKKLLKEPVKSKKINAPALWWANDSDDDSLKKGNSKSFLKTKKSSESPVRSKAGKDAPGKQGVGSKVQKTKTSGSSKQVTSPRKSGRSNRTKGKRENSPGNTRGSKSKIDTSMSKDSLEDISEKSEEHDIHDQLHHRDKINPLIPIHDSSIDTSASFEGANSSQSREHVGFDQSGRSRDNPGFDTLDEQMDKQKFFQNIENGSDGTVDYGRLNQELSQTGTAMLSPGLNKNSALIGSHLSGEGAVTSTPLRNQNMDITDSSTQKPSMLSKVALDSIDSTLNTTTSPKVGNSRDTTQDNLAVTLPDSLKTQGFSGHMGTNTSKEMEALQLAYQKVDMSPTIYGGGDSRPATGKTSEANERSHPLEEKKAVDRSVGDILREMDAIDRRGYEIENEEDRVQLRSDYKSPRSPRSPGLARQYHIDDGGFDHSHTEDTELYQPVTAVTVKEKKSESRGISRDDSSQSISVISHDEKTRAGRDRFAHVQSSGYGRPSSPSRKPRSKSAGKSPSKTQGHLGSRSPGQDGTKVKKMESSPTFNLQKVLSKGLPQNSDLLESVESFTKYIKEHLATQQQLKEEQEQSKLDYARKTGHNREAALLEEVKDLREQWNTARTTNNKMQAEMASVEREHKKEIDSLKFKYEEEIFSLKQENFVMASKLKELENGKDGKSSKGDILSASGSQGDGENGMIARLEREVREQEDLLAGYQAENKRLYEEIKGAQKQAKATESSMFRENQRLTAELANLRQELELKNTELHNKGIITSVAAQQQIAAGNAEAVMGANRISHLEGELSEAKRVQENQGREIKLLQQNKFELEKHVEGLLVEKESMARQLTNSLTPDQVKDLEGNHRVEMDKLKQKLKWYAENQELLDKSNSRLRAKEDEIHKLKLRLEDFKSEAGMKLEENKMRTKEKAADAKKIQDLERQVKEMEQVIRRRHPNSLPAMMMVAATVPDSVTDNNVPKGRSVQALETRIKKLERQLEEKDELAQQDLRAVEQKYNHIKLQFEERIADLEQQLSLYTGRTGGEAVLKGHPHSHALALERELERVRDRSKKQVSELQGEVDRVTAELNKVRKNQENMMRNEVRQSEGEWKQQVQALRRELQDRDHDIQLLHHTVEKMRSQLESGRKKSNSSRPEKTMQEWPPFPNAPSSSREYQPGDFADSGMSTVLQENQQLKLKLEAVQLELDQQRVDLRRSLAQTEAKARQNAERLENELEVMQNNHKTEIQTVLAEQALRSSSSRTAELQSQCNTQEVMIRHLQAQLKKASKEAESVPLLKAEQSKLQAKIQELQDKLKDAKHFQTPEMRHFESLEEKLSDLVHRQRQREADLDSVVKQKHLTGRVELEEEVDKWKAMVEAKNQQLQVFRGELDSILEVLKALQRQGVTLPVGTLYS